jgi:hypothetical protein
MKPEVLEQLVFGKGIYDCLCDPYDKHKTGDNYGSVMDDLERFAELIVRECAKVADIADENKCEWIGGNILTHFGVAS